jgi:hypothetical protein
LLFQGSLTTPPMPALLRAAGPPAEAFRMGEASAKSVWRACLRRCHGNPETRAILKNVKAGDRVKSFG